MSNEVRNVLFDPTNKPLPKDHGFPKFRAQLSLTFVFIGFLIFLLGLRPDLFGLDRGRSIGLIQISAILFGLGVMTWSGTSILRKLWNGNKKTIVGDFGTRVVATGFVICSFAALADAFGLGTNPVSNVLLGTVQSYGLMAGIAMVCVGLLMLIKPKKIKRNSDH